VASCLHVLPPKFCVHFSYPSYVPHSQPISSSVVWSETTYMEGHKSCNLHYVIFSILLVLPPYWVQISFSVPSSRNTISIYSSLNMKDQFSHPYNTTAVHIFPKCVSKR
jgi:hypothetical protein